MTTIAFENLGSLITYREDGHDQCLGHLMEFADKGVFEPNLGKVDIDPQYVSIHNKLLDEALIKGLDETCKIGQGGLFYYCDDSIPAMVKTWTGLLVSADVTVKGRSITFKRRGQTFRGRLADDDGAAFNFKRVG